jgi:zinc protease
MTRYLSYLLTLLCPAAAAQGPDRETTLRAAREIIASARYAALITRADDGTLQARTIDPFAPEADFTIWFATNPRTRKVTEIRADPRVTLYWFDPAVEGYVTLKGTARLVDDAEEKRRRWKPEWAPFYPDREHSYLLVAVRPQRMEVVSPRHGITGDAVTWRPPLVEFPPSEPASGEWPTPSLAWSRHSNGPTALLATDAVAQAPLRVPYVMDTLPNGLRVIVHEDHSVPMVAVNVWYHVGSADETPGRTGLAHLFEHLMFMGSQHAPYPQFDRLLEAAGATNNGSTTPDRTNYFEEGPANALPLMLWLEADRMGWMLPTMDQAKVDLQRDVVKNERRQSYENQPYGLAFENILRLLYPPGHPYSWPTIGSMADLSAASLEDVRDFFRTYYAPNNAVLAIVGAVRAAEVFRAVRRYFGEIPPGPPIQRPVPQSFALPRDTAEVLEDRVQLPRLYYAWHTVRSTHADDAALRIAAYVLTGARNSRLTERLVYRDQLASSVNAFQSGKRLDGDFQVVATARPGKSLPDLQHVIDEELARLAGEGPTSRELDQAKNAIESAFLNSLERIGAKADRLNAYYYETGNPDGFQADVERFRAVTAADVQRVVRTYLLAPKVVLSVVPQGRRDLAARTREATP